uniref:Uncharacterized protein n=1 Tax=Myripristis murdjan TaxID=586833 RepID=A0A667XXX9_9TELE
HKVRVVLLPQICYVLDGILFLYGVVLTALYCRLKVRRDSLLAVLTHSYKIIFFFFILAKHQSSPTKLS